MMETATAFISPSVTTAATVAAAVAGFVVIWWFLLRPRPGGRQAPPLVTNSTVVPIPLIGHIAEFFKSPNEMVKRCYRDYGSIFTIPIFHKRITFLIGPAAQEIFFKASDDVLSQNEVYNFMEPVFGKGIVYDAPRKNRQVQFQATANGLRTNRLKAYVSKIEDETRQYLQQHWNQDGEGGTVDLLTALSELTILTASRCLHGDDVRTHIFKEVQSLYHDLDHGLTPLTVFWPHAPTQAHRKRNAARLEMVRLFTNVIQERREHPERSDGTDILSLYMDIHYKDGSPISMEQVTGMLIALLFAGQHTSCISSTWTTLFLADTDKKTGKFKWTDRLLAEQEKVLKGDLTKRLDFDDVQEMEFLHNAMREALRLCPTFIMLLRLAEQDIPLTLNGQQVVIPKGDIVAVSPTVSMRLKSTFDNPDMFDPDRYLPPREEHKTPFAYLGFGGGLHSCMGQNFAFVQVKCILSILFREYEITRVAPEMPAVGYDDMVVGPKGDCRIRYKKRNLDVKKK